MIRKSEAGTVETLERGNIYFIYQPRVEQEQAQGPEDVQRLYMVLSPHGRKMYRMAIVGHKRMPQPEESGRDQYWGFIDKVATEPTDIENEFDPAKYRTKTRGEREIPPARPAGEGVYRILRHGDHTHLVYTLELPVEPGEVQRALQLEKEASYIITVKNPEKGSPRAAGLSEDRQARYPESLQERFRGRRFFDIDPPDFLDHEGCEFLLVSASADISEELGIELNAQRETEDTAEAFNDLRMERSQHPVKPLLKGEWE